MTDQELTVQEKQELSTNVEQTVPGKFYSPYTDIYEAENSLTLVIDMPGVETNNVNIQLEKDVLTIEGRIDYSNYAGLEPRYTEYNIGHYSRQFSLSKKIDQDGIRAKMQDGVLSLTLPKVKEAPAKKIEVNAT